MGAEMNDPAGKLHEIWAKVKEAAHDEAEKYIATRYPYTYAADFLRGHTHLLPESVYEVVKPVSARADVIDEAWNEFRYPRPATEAPTPGFRRAIAAALEELDTVVMLRVINREEPIDLAGLARDIREGK